jgi:Protein of unknown function (DUF1592)/Protein of unknown function (DUF1588)/Protein of unknown function (DUF1587)/Protein of unknown function (DUF1585)/Protein of unknown function (DUF1595)
MGRSLEVRSHTPRGVAIICALVLSLASGRLAGADEVALAAHATSMLRQYCLDCHGKDLAEARINLDQMTDKPDLGRGFKDWEKVAGMLRQGKMPPKDAPQPSATERASSIAAIEEALKAFISRHAGDPGPVVLRRLTSAEFGYTIEDLTGLDLKLERRFVSDAVGGEGFTNVGGAQFMQDSTLEQYLDAAKAVAGYAVIGAGPLTFFEHPGQTGRELSAITRIKEIYRRTGFRTAAGEGAKPFGLDLFPRAMLVAWRYRHRTALGLGDATLDKLARDEGLSVRLCEHIWQVLNGPASSFPLSAIVAQWQALPSPAEGRPTGAEIRAACDRVGSELRQWQSVLAAAAGDEEEAAVLTEGDVQIQPQHSLVADLDWADGVKSADIEFSVASASKQPASGAIVVWHKPRLRFIRGDNRRREIVPLASVLSPETVDSLKLGRHPAGATIGQDDFVIADESKLPIRILVPDGMIAARLFVDVELDTKQGADAIVRCRISDGDVAGETAAEVGDTSTLLGNPASPRVAEWQTGVAEFARLLPEVSHREPTPSDRDPIPSPFDNAYNMPERNHFHTAIKYYRDDRFLVTHVLDDATRVELDQAWTDLLTSFEYHDANLSFTAKKFGVDLGSKGIADLGPEDISRFPAEARGFIERLRDEYREMQRALQAAEQERVADAIRLARRAWRRPLSAVEQQRLRDFYQTLRRDSGLEHTQAMRALLVRILVAPAFLYRAESAGGQSEARGQIVSLSDWELASRLSYVVWSSLPDEKLLRAAAAGELRNSDELARQARRMLRDPKARRLASEFFGQWLGFYRFDEYRGIDAERFPEFNEGLKAAMYDEAVSFFEHIIREDRPVEEILFADYTFVNGPLARHYRLDATEVPEERHIRVAAVAGEHRGGLLGMGAVLASTSAPLRTSAVKRGDWVLRRVIGTPVPPPPADAGSIAADDAGADGLTVRQRLEAHRTNRTCINCHSRIDPLGFALEHYDPLGRWRDQYRDGRPIDSSGVLSDGTKIDGLDGLRRYLRGQQPQFERNLCDKLLGYTLGRAELASDRPLIDEMLSDLKREGGFSNLVVRIVTSKQFRYRRL